MKIAVCDDEKAVRGALVQQIRQLGNQDEITELEDARALSFSAAGQFEVIFLDIEMPGMSGFTTLEQLRKRPEGKQFPVIFFTGRQDRDTVKCCAAAGAEGYIAKPIEKHTLLTRVKEVFDRLPERSEKKTLLILNQNMEQLKKRKLELADKYRVIGITSLRQAEDYFSSHKADIILLSEEVLLQEGTEAFRKLKGLPTASEAKVLLMGSGKEPENGQDLPDMGIAGYQTVDVSAEELQKTLEEI